MTPVRHVVYNNKPNFTLGYRWMDSRTLEIRDEIHRSLTAAYFLERT